MESYTCTFPETLGSSCHDGMVDGQRLPRIVDVGFGVCGRPLTTFGGKVVTWKYCIGPGTISVHGTSGHALRLLGVLEVLQWVRPNDCPWDEDTCTYAAAGGHLGGIAMGPRQLFPSMGRVKLAYTQGSSRYAGVVDGQ